MNRLVACVLVAAGSLIAAPVSMAQDRVMVMATQEAAPGMGGSGRISRNAVDAYARLLSLSEDQKAAAHALHEGYEAAHSKASKDFSAALSDMRRTAEEQGDHSVFMEQMPKAREELTKKTKELERTFMSDLQSLLSDDQAAHWSKVERHRRRDVLLRPGSISGEGVNLLETVDGLKLDDAAMGALAETMLGYETDIDRALQAKERMLDEAPSFDPGRGFDPEAFRERMKKSREAGLRVREINEQYQRRIEGSLPEEKKAAFNAAVRREMFPLVYRTSAVSRAISAAAKFDDLTTEQKDSITSLLASYERDAAAANDRWANEIEAAEKKGDNGGEMAIPGGGRMQVRFGEEDEKSPLVQARKARSELDERTRSRLDSILSKDQKERLPKEAPEGRPGRSQFIIEESRSR